MSRIGYHLRGKKAYRSGVPVRNAIPMVLYHNDFGILAGMANSPRSQSCQDGHDLHTCPQPWAIMGKKPSGWAWKMSGLYGSA